MRFVAAFLLLAAASFSQTRDPLPVPAVPPYKTLKCDFHMHTVFSDGEVWPTTRVAEAWRDGLDVIAITDHAGYNPHKPDVPADLARAIAIARPAAALAGILLVPAVEVAEGDLHANLLFVTDANAFFDLNLLDALRKGRQQNAYAFWNHPGWKGPAQWFPTIAAAHSEGLLQGMELVNGLDMYKEAYPWIDEKKLAIIANSDTHAPIEPQYSKRQRPLTLVFASAATEPAIREALLARRTAAWMGGEVWGSAGLLEGLWKNAVRISATEINVAAARRTVRLELQNASAIPFKLTVRKAPAWLTLRIPEVAPEKIAGASVTIAKDAPSGKTQAAVELEITNLHTGPGQNLVVSLPLTVTVGP
jgi:hypothetical protein